MVNRRSASELENDLLHCLDAIDRLVFRRPCHLGSYRRENTEGIRSATQHEGAADHDLGLNLSGTCMKGKYISLRIFAVSSESRPQCFTCPTTPNNLDGSEHNHVHLLSHRILPRKDVLRHHVVDHHDVRRGGRVPLAEESAFQQGNAHHARVIGGCDMKQRRHPVLRRLRSGAKPKGNLAVALTERNKRGDGGPLYAGNGIRPCEQFRAFKVIDVPRVFRSIPKRRFHKPTPES
jgi:hypothetical protein